MSVKPHELELVQAIHEVEQKFKRMDEQDKLRKSVEEPQIQSQSKLQNNEVGASETAGAGVSAAPTRNDF